jgi:adenylate cyclase
MRLPGRPTLQQAFLGAMALLSILLGLLFSVVLAASRRSVLASADAVRDATATRIVDQVSAYLNQAGTTAQDVERLVRLGVVRADDPAAVEAALFAQVASKPDLAEATFTRADIAGYAPSGDPLVVPARRVETSVLRVGDGGAPILLTRRVREQASTFAREERRRVAGGTLDSVPFVHTSGVADDPTTSLTFQGAAHEANRGTVLWSDLHYSPDALPGDARPVVVTAQKAVEDASGRFVGVVRVGLLTAGIDDRLRSESARQAPHRLFLCDAQGRLLSRVGPGDELREMGDDLRVATDTLDGAMRSALAQPAIAAAASSPNAQPAAFTADGRRWLATYRALPGTQGFIVGVLAPEEHYTRGLEHARRMLLIVMLGIIALTLLGGLLMLTALQRSLARVVRSTARMEEFDFAASPNAHAGFRDVDTVLQRLEQAKTAMRAMGKYVPIDLVRLLYRENREPRLGAELADVTVLFTDIADFTTLAERLPPDELSRVLGRYLDVMTTTIQQTGGTIDKYIGDAVMALWNVPLPCARPAEAACRAALLCVRDTEALFASEEWTGRPPLVTRFGLHADAVMVGHFGAPDRFSYTALGDGVNLGARLEGLNKQYGTRILVSEAVQSATADVFRFRLVDRVAVKGRVRGVAVYELLGLMADTTALPAHAAYAAALEAYWRRAFEEALRLLEPHAGDGPSRVLAARCRALSEDPPPPDWDGVYVAHAK